MNLLSAIELKLTAKKLEKTLSVGSLESVKPQSQSRTFDAIVFDKMDSMGPSFPYGSRFS